MDATLHYRMKLQISRMLQQLGAQAMAAAINRSTAHIYRFANLHEDALPSMAHAVALDTAFAKRFGTTPLTDLMREGVALNLARENAPTESISKGIMDITASVGNAAQSYSEALDDDHISANEAKRIGHGLQAIKQQVNQAIHALAHYATAPRA